MKTKFNGILTLLLALVVQFTFAQEKQISGTVTDETGPLPGVSVIIKGTSTGAETDFDGLYTITAKQGDILIFSYVGMDTKSVTVGSSNTLNVTLTGGNLLDEVVISAFGTKRQSRSLGYSATKVSSAELTEVSTSNPLESLSGKVAGVDISAPAQPGASAKVIFRGFGSITGSNSPLYIIDGSPIQDGSSSSTGATSSFDAGSGINDIDSNSIESINFLKGAAATALYGSRGSNGVIVITTKRGKDKLKISVSNSIDIHEVARTPHFQQSFGTGWAGVSYSNVVGEGSLAASNENGSWGPLFNGEVRPWSRIIDNQQLIKPYSVLEDNIRNFYTIGSTYSNSLSVSSGNEKSDVAFTYSRIDSDGVIPTDNDSFKKNNFGLNAGIKKGGFSARMSANYSHKKQKAVATGQGDDASFGKGLTQELIQIPNDVSILDMEDQSVIFNTPSYFYTPYAANIYKTLNNNFIGIEKDRFFGNVSFRYEFNDNFSTSLKVSTDIDNEIIKRHGAIVEYIDGSPQDNADANGVVGAVSEGKYTRREFDTYFNLNYNKQINDKINVSVLAGINFNERNGETLYASVFDLDLPNYYELSNSASTPNIFQSDYVRRVFGIYSQAEVSYDNKHFLTLTARNDQSSTLPIENNSYFYPSASLASVVVDDGSIFTKLRAGWARIGNDTNMYQVFSTAGQASNAAYFGSIQYPFGGVNSYEIFGRIENQDLGPEITDEIEIGFESRFLGNRLGLDVSLYNRKTDDLIVNLPVARSTGYGSVTGNFVDLENKGIELTFTAKPVVTDNFRWDLTYTFTKNKSKVLDVIGEESKIAITSAYGVNFYAEEGQPLGVFYAPSPAKTDAGQIIANESTGYYTYSGQEEAVGTSQRDFIMGLRNSFKYKNFKLAFSLDWKQGGKMYSYTKRLSHFVGNGIETTYNGRNSWIIPNSVIEDPALLEADENYEYDPSNPDDYIENTSAVQFDKVTAFYNMTQNPAAERTHIIDKTFVRVRDLSLAYNVPSDVVKDLGLSSLSFSIYGKNLFLWTPGDNPYVDPETTNYGRGITSEFGEFATNPSQRTYGASLKLSF